MSDHAQDSGKFGSKRKHEELNDELLTMLKVSLAVCMTVRGESCMGRPRFTPS